MYFLELLILIYCVFICLYGLLFSLAGLFYRKPFFIDDPKVVMHRVAVMIPAYKEDGVIIDVARHSKNQNYPDNLYDVVVIADSLQPQTIETLRNIPVVVHEVSFEKSTKVKALRSFLNTWSNYDIAVILDADNLMDPDFLHKINSCYCHGWHAIQGQRKAKNKNTSFAFLDGLSEAVNNHIYRKGAYVMGLSSSLSGSGMAFKYPLLKDMLNSFDAVGGFDKVLQARLAEKKVKIHYLAEAVVLDEKVEDHQVFQKQRTRWVSSQYIYFKRYFMKGVKGLLKGNLALFNLTVLMNGQLPRILNFGILALLSIISILFHKYVYLSWYIWMALFTSYLFLFLIAIPGEYYNRRLLKAILQVPKAFFTMVFIHFRLKNADKTFIHTPHKYQK